MLHVNLSRRGEQFTVSGVLMVQFAVARDVGYMAYLELDGHAQKAAGGTSAMAAPRLCRRFNSLVSRQSTASCAWASWRAGAREGWRPRDHRAAPGSIIGALKSRCRCAGRAASLRRPAPTARTAGAQTLGRGAEPAWRPAGIRGSRAARTWTGSPRKKSRHTARTGRRSATPRDPGRSACSRRSGKRSTGTWWPQVGERRHGGGLQGRHLQRPAGGRGGSLTDGVSAVR